MDKKDNLIKSLIVLNVSNYRLHTQNILGKVHKEPVDFESNLKQIYSKLDYKSLQKLWKLTSGEKLIINKLRNG